VYKSMGLSPAAIVEPEGKSVRRVAVARAAAPRTSIRAYNVGYGDCTLLSLESRGTIRHVLVNCGVILGTPNAQQILSKVAADVCAITGARIDLLIVTRAHWDKVGGFEQAREIFETCAVEEVMAGLSGVVPRIVPTLYAARLFHRVQDGLLPRVNVALRDIHVAMPSQIHGSI
jgi:hypothetical protein